MAESPNDSNTCVVCFKEAEYFSIGECDHPVCYECSTRMRVLCMQNECPICRHDLAKVIFTETVQLYKDLRNRAFSDRLFERQYKIGFCSEAIKNAYERLLENRCKICEKIPPFRNFSALSDHMRKVHERYFCDLCVKHLMIFTSERRCYTRQELAHHRRKGDVDDTSHRGHPLCEFCEERFMDADDLYRHLRKEHLYCHLCDVDGRNLYYASHAALAHHFRTDHFLCEEGDCAGNHLTAVFRTEIDLKAHKATVHGAGMTRGAARQARTLELQFNITPHAGTTQRTPRDRERPQEAPSPPLQPPSQRIDTRSDQQFPRLSAAPPASNLLLHASNKVYKGRIKMEGICEYFGDNLRFNGAEGLARTDRNFPTLGGAGPARPVSTPASAPAPTTPRPNAPVAAVVKHSKPVVSIQLHSQPASASHFRLTQTSGNRVSTPQQRKAKALDDDDFPSLGGMREPRDDHPSLGAGSVQPSKMSLINSQEMQALKTNNNVNNHPKKPQLSSEAFPALSASSGPSNPPQWITVSKGKEKAKPSKQNNQQEQPQTPKEPAFNPVADFPNLPVNKTKSKKVNNPTPVQTPRPQPQPTPKQKPVSQEPKVSKKEEQKPSKKEEQKPTKKEKKKSLISEDTPDAPNYVNCVNDKFSKKQMKEAYQAALSDNNNQSNMGTKIQTIVETSPTSLNSEKRRNGGNGDFAISSKDFPTLNKSSSILPTAPPLKYGKIVNGNVPAPPGFKSRPPCDGMTFTNSAGQTFPAPVHNYVPPPDFEQRNRELVQQFVSALGSAEAVEDFKVASRAYRDSIITADEFFQHCKRAMGPHLDDVFPELVALLPDIGKQQELIVGRNMEPDLSVCSTCGQIVAAKDAVGHDTTHWPALT